jgi:hypothetical protein
MRCGLRIHFNNWIDRSRGSSSRRRRIVKGEPDRHLNDVDRIAVEMQGLGVRERTFKRQVIRARDGTRVVGKNSVVELELRSDPNLGKAVRPPGHAPACLKIGGNRRADLSFDAGRGGEPEKVSEYHVVRRSGVAKEVSRYGGGKKRRLVIYCRCRSIIAPPDGLSWLTLWKSKVAALKGHRIRGAISRRIANGQRDASGRRWNRKRRQKSPYRLSGIFGLNPEVSDKRNERQNRTAFHGDLLRSSVSISAIEA